jgi:SET domain-containing protein
MSKNPLGLESHYKVDEYTGTKTKRRIPNIKNDLVTIKKSKIEGLGVFAAKDIEIGTKITDYYGKDMKWKTFKNKYGEYKSNSLHTYPMRRIWRILVAKEEPYKSKNLTNYVNEIPGKANCELRMRALYAKKNIKKGDELLLDYPKDYNRFWLKEKKRNKTRKKIHYRNK